MRDLDGFKNASWVRVTESGAEKTLAVFTEYVDAAHTNGALYDRGLVSGSSWESLDPAPGAGMQRKAWYIPLSNDQLAAIKQEGVKVPAEVESVQSIAGVRAKVNAQFKPVPIVVKEDGASR